MRNLSLAAAAALVAFPASLHAETVADTISADMPGLMDTYRDLHAHPELSFQEVRSAAVMARAAREAGFEVTEKVGKTGIVAVLKNGPGPTVLIRADMDGLPVTEQTGLPFASKQRGVSTAGVESGIMHACGHDTHMTAWIETARLMAARKADWSGTLVMIGQPAEEIGLGAVEMLKDGLYTRFPKPDYTLAFHDTPELPSGVVGAAEGYALANVDSVDILVKGVGGHGAYPQATKDPIVLASAIVMKLQTLASREINPLDPVVVTVGSFHAGTKHNIISDQAKLELTVRSYSDETRAKLLSGIRRIVKGEALASGIPEDLMPEVTVEEPYTRSTYNSPEFTQEAIGFLQQEMGKDRAVITPSVMGGEDFGEFRRADEDHIKSVIFWVGGSPADKIAAARAGGAPLPSLHSPFWAPEADKVIASGAEALTLTAMRLMAR
ncbi:amidohydrolase [Novosphingobium mangrovi (ex Huang et al. 2023)]|uniref:Amidohydrolase n=1 Tax=Novosphingobium mangrovi (ex Huang et al. 2023) TaxID=2976432 RepID=A0ABT2I5G7_9SPHN|nr:amidohydrolase [Novosphingobium mangrovi (ex Huang et al. 2023)]MCT2400045.1 amidohydrolase [Novosphingobium mangrovi (ex Huang et al. 2023)]